MIGWKSGGNVLYHSCCQVWGRPLNTFTWFTEAGGMTIWYLRAAARELPRHVGGVARGNYTNVDCQVQGILKDVNWRDTAITCNVVAKKRIGSCLVVGSWSRGGGKCMVVLGPKRSHLWQDVVGVVSWHAATDVVRGRCIALSINTKLLIYLHVWAPQDLTHFKLHMFQQQHSEKVLVVVLTEAAIPPAKNI